MRPARSLSAVGPDQLAIKPTICVVEEGMFLQSIDCYKKHTRNREETQRAAPEIVLTKKSIHSIQSVVMKVQLSSISYNSMRPSKREIMSLSTADDGMMVSFSLAWVGYIHDHI